MQHRPPRRVAEAHALVADRPGDGAVHSAGTVGDGRLDLHDLHHAFGLGAGALHRLRGVRQRFDRVVQGRDIGDEDDDGSGGDGVFEREQPADVEHRGGAERQHEPGRELEPHAGQRAARVGTHGLRGVVAEVALLVVLARERLHRRDRAQRLLHHGGHPPLGVALVTGPFPHRAPEEARREKDQRDHADGDQRQLPFERDHHDQHRDERRDRLDHRQHGAGQQRVHGVRVGGDTLDQIARFALGVEQQREPLQVAEQVACKRPGHVLPERQGGVAREHRGDRAHEVDHHLRDHHPHEQAVFAVGARHRAQPVRDRLVADHVVDQDLQRPRAGEARRHANQRGADHPGEAAPVGAGVAQQLQLAPPRRARRRLLRGDPGGCAALAHHLSLAAGAVSALAHPFAADPL